MNKTKLQEHIIKANKSCTYNYIVEKSFTCGMVLQGWEVKSIRAKQISLVGAYANIHDGELWLKGATVKPLMSVCQDVVLDNDRAKKLLLNKRDIISLCGHIKKSGLTLVPLNVKLVGPLIKCTICLARGKTKYDKRYVLKKRAIQRDIEKARKS